MSQSPHTPQQDDGPFWEPVWNNDRTEPFVVHATAPIPSLHPSQQIPVPSVPGTSRGQGFQRGMQQFSRAVMRKVNQLLGLAALILLLLLLARFLLHFFGITTSIFTEWVYQVTGPIVYPFENLVAPIAYSGFSIDVTTIIAAVVWLVVIMLVHRFLRILFGK